MICANCKKKIDEPLLLYNGSLTCPSCKKLLTAVDNFCITEENEELYRLSENMFFRSLTSSDKNKQRNYRLKAVDYCKKAAIAGHPYAIVRLGYYYEKGLAEPSSKRESERGWRIAYGFYSSVCFCDEDKQLNISLKRLPTAYQDNDHFLNLRKTAAAYLLDMLLTTDESFDAIPRFNYAKNREKVLRTLGIHQDSMRAGGQEKNRMEMVEGVLAGCLEKKHAPLFGYVYLRAGELAQFMEVKEDGKSLFERLKSKSVEFRFIDSNEKGVIEANGDDESFHRVQNLAQVETEGFEHHNGYFVFYNEKNGKRVLKNSAVTAVKNSLVEGFGSRWRSFILAAQSSSRVFFEDDIRQYVKVGMVGMFSGSKGYADAVDKLLKVVQEEE
ncbi:MAG: hypothetical protein J6S04_02425 [Clostridia bacterium]|nr:hypothetical protein [Clostridia bacterium]